MDAQLQMALFETETPPDGAAPVWETLDEEQRAEVVGVMAQVIAKAACYVLGIGVADEEKGDDD